MIDREVGMPDSAARMRILQMIEDGQVSAAEGLKLLDALGADDAAAVPATAEAAPAAGPDLDYWRRWWLVPMWAGIGVLLVGAGLMFAAYQAGGFGVLFFFGRLPVARRVALLALAA